ncbi:heparan-alpha-glucosaminide N-acetyltransferase domain-containing protein [Kocuria sp. CPCC 205268]|uniref:heparan-alpha-glucosaminide N-acetyltransferase domain-containing protein n=1 Tax=Kocuria oxytropis TaxID=3058913 RepID=UPI0034D49586
MSADRTPPPETAATTGVLNPSGSPAGDAAGGARPSRRLRGVDAARGFALFGMVAVHTLPLYVEETGDPTLTWTLFAGHSSALFATLAGVSLAFTTGGRTPHTGRRRTASRWAQVGRAAIIALVGFLLGFLELPWHNILVYYGVFFLLAIPFLGLRIRSLLLSAALFALIAPFLMQWSLDRLPAHVYSNPSLLDLVQDPGGVAAHLLLTGSYPALPWMTFVCAGIALGRMNLADRRVQAALTAVGAVLAALSWGVSALALRLGGYEAIAAATPSMSAEQIDEIIVFGADPELPTTTLWWLLVSAAHSNTPFSLLLSLGIAMVTLGVFLLLPGALGRVLTPLTAMGAMTFTLYVSHLLVMWLELFYDAPAAWFWGQILVFAVVAVLWQRYLGQGPLEKVVTRSTRAISRRVLARGGDGTPRPAPWTAPRQPDRR